MGVLDAFGKDPRVLRVEPKTTFLIQFPWACSVLWPLIWRFFFFFFWVSVTKPFLPVVWEARASIFLAIGSKTTILLLTNNFLKYICWLQGSCWASHGMTQGKLIISNGIKFCVLTAAQNRAEGNRFFFFFYNLISTFILRGHLRLRKEKVG